MPAEDLNHGAVERSPASSLAERTDEGWRHLVRLSKDNKADRNVGARRVKPVILTIDVGRMQREGHEFDLSAIGVWLTDTVPPCYQSGWNYIHGLTE